jgi:hypothetical protein
MTRANRRRRGRFRQVKFGGSEPTRQRGAARPTASRDLAMKPLVVLAPSYTALLRAVTIASRWRGQPEFEAVWMIVAFANAVSTLAGHDAAVADRARALDARVCRLHHPSRSAVDYQRRHASESRRRNGCRGRGTCTWPGCIPPNPPRRRPVARPALRSRVRRIASSPSPSLSFSFAYLLSALLAFA